MPVTQQTPYIEYIANGSTASFALPFDCDNADYLVVKIDDVEAVGTWTMQDSTVVFITAPSTDKVVSIERNTPLERSTNYQTYDNSFLPKPVNKDFDKVWWKLQELGYKDSWLLQKLLQEIQDRITADQEYDLLAQGREHDLKLYLESVVNNLIGNNILPLQDSYIQTWSRNTQEQENKDFQTSVYDYSELENLAVVDGRTAYVSKQGLSGDFIYDASSVVSSNGGTIISSVHGGNWLRVFTGDVHAEWFGIVGDYTTDNLAALTAADTYCFNNGKSLRFGFGMFSIVGSIDKRSRWVGAASPIMGTFPSYQDDKRFMSSVQGLKGSEVPFTAIILKGAATSTFTISSRSDEFSSFSYGIRNVGLDGNKYKNNPFTDIGVVLDFEMYESDGTTLTTPSTDAQADYDAGVIFDTNFKIDNTNLTVFGYFPVVGVLNTGANSDYITFTGGSLSGNIGLAIVGDGSNGLSGTQTYNTNIYSKDHHSRSVTDEDWGKNCIYIDGGSYQISGHYFFGGNIRTHVDVPIRFENCTNADFILNCFELTNNAASSVLTTSKRFTATANTAKLSFINPRWTSFNPITIAGGLIDTLTAGVLTYIGSETVSDIGVWSAGHGLRLQASASESSINFTDNPRSSVQRYKIRYDVSANTMQFKYAGSNILSLGSTGVLTPVSTGTLGTSSNKFAASYSTKQYYTATLFDGYGTGSPEGVLTAGIGSTYRRSDGGASTSFYIKESGTGNTGWVAK